MKNRTLTQCLPWLLGLGLLVGCDGDSRPLEEAVEAQELRLSALTIRPGRTLQTPVFVSPGETIQFLLSGVNTSGNPVTVDATDRRWSVDNPAVASISDSGLLTAAADGQTLVTTRIGGVVSAAFEVNVSGAALQAINPLQGTDLSQCSEASYTATGTYADGSTRNLDGVVWTLPPADPPVAPEQLAGRILGIDGRNVTVGAVRPGNFVLRASFEDVFLDSTISVSANLSSLEINTGNVIGDIAIERGETRQLTARATYSTPVTPSPDDATEPDADATTVSVADVSSVVLWGVSNTAIASISNATGSAGQVTGLTAGSGTVNATCGDMSDVANLQVSEPAIINQIELDPDDSPIIITLSGGSIDVRAFANSARGGRIEVTNEATWTIFQGEENVSVDNSGTTRGELTPLAVGTANLRVSYRSVEREVSIRVNQ